MGSNFRQRLKNIEKKAAKSNDYEVIIYVEGDSGIETRINGESYFFKSWVEVESYQEKYERTHPNVEFINYRVEDI